MTAPTEKGSTLNLFEAMTAAADGGERFDSLVSRDGFLVERIVSLGHTTPPDAWLAQERAEWVVLLRGAARLYFEGEEADRTLAPGDHLLIPPHTRHRVTWTAPEEPSVWLALHFYEGVAG